MPAPAVFESAFNSSPSGAYLLSPTPDAIVLAVNDAFLKASRRKREELVGTSLFVAFPANPDDPTDTGETDLRRSLARVLACGEPDRLPAQRYPIPVEGAGREHRVRGTVLERGQHAHLRGRRPHRLHPAHQQ